MRKEFTMITIDNTALMFIDYQGRLAQIMDEREKLHTKIIQLIKGMKILDVPVIWVEQYPQGLGHTEKEVKQILKKTSDPIAKVDFSACRNEEVQAVLNKLERETYLVAGIEAHVCVYQTVQQLLLAEKHVEIVQDAISSRTAENKQIAIDKMSLLGAYPTSVEMALFELMKTSKHPRFREISQLIK